MNIKCNYCDSMFDETLEKCPSCGAPNSNVKRTTVDQPTTIEELKDWYKSKELPPYETTRFFIGENYKGARAFGIYRDERSGKFVVYKNKDTGQRAVRYEGTDEAYAVNELFMRLKDEILQQKARNAGIRTEAEERAREDAIKSFANKDEHEEAKRDAYNYYYDQARKRNHKIKTIISGSVIIGVAVLIFAILLTSAIKPKPKPVYYGDPGSSYSSSYSSSSGSSSSDSYFTPPTYTDSKPGEGYYKIGDDYYYHNGYDNYSWFVYDGGDWDYVQSADVPETLQRESTANQYSYSPNWESESKVSDFTTTNAYLGTHPQHESSDYSYSSGSSHSSSSWWSSSSDSSWDSDSSWSWSSSDSWDSGSTDWSSDW
ncbi:MAG: hypothetical protein J6X97_04475 [Lachnospiraceae bacterium]|nr:hypothetical protein [Lachnospiraceae bacterium]